MESVKMGGQHVRVEMDHLNGYIMSYWENTTEGSKVITDYVTNLFNIDVSDIWASKQSFHIIQHVISRQKTPLKNHWLSGGCPRLKLFCARTGSVDILQVLDGLIHNAVFVENCREYTSPFGYSRILSFGVDVRRVDGVTATVCLQETGILVIAVWPEATYNYN
ncbi:hypothetical protein GCK72_015595 [Caenorhabditis remanei]|uniref:Uncharacterized protein n=1 Tax=Caenorhabditis remanei TaxID=31234 RepID=A0A6A5GWX3_CAERE|nr:hypothetical protein GCK72_015595 [Caenorhabditis remanei]KAF1759134.1 hypothetical protein GCK72_015595 [Caenorhabditis remanei]